MQNSISIIEDIVRSYPEMVEKRNALRLEIGERCKQRPTEAAAIALLAPEDERRLNAIDIAIRHTYRLYDDGKLRMRLIQATYWGFPFSTTIENISAETAQEWKHDFLQAVTQRLGLTTCENCIYWLPLRIGGVMACQYCYQTGKLRIHDRNRCYSKQISGI